MSAAPVSSLHAQLAAVMEVLANAAVAEICALVDGGLAALRRENEALRRQVRLAETRAGHPGPRMRVRLHPGPGPRPRPGPGPGSGTGTGTRVPTGERDRVTKRQAAPTRASRQEPLRCRDPSPPTSESDREPSPPMATAFETTVVIKVEDDEPWLQAEESFCRVADGQMSETKASPPLGQQDAASDDHDDGGGGVSSQSWMSGEVSSTSTHSVLAGGLKPEPGGYECPVLELEAGPRGPQVSLVTEASGVLPVHDEPPGGFHAHKQRAAPPLPDKPIPDKPLQDEPRPPPTGHGAGTWRRPDPRGRHDPGLKPYGCTFCGKTLACLKNLKTHMRVHTGEKPFVCPLCGKRFSDSSNLKRHQSVHTGEKRYGCVHCGKRFAQSGSLKVHMSVHTDCKQFRCSQCGKTFISGVHLRRHLAGHAVALS
ncbi:zinc finger protein with KRAB and SCAN domains 1-like [Cololabis saira]|uniref:zinc finger protein with KRAB and SCAN domains 1-like n=1 Tax=Cololabis saira TaxID=129043 RepID=UPI002AD2F31E|nr:zinc finger protein with KRAB and SCAN domains 1-like [Cololabis saira]